MKTLISEAGGSDVGSPCSAWTWAPSMLREASSCRAKDPMPMATWVCWVGTSCLITVVASSFVSYLESLLSLAHALHFNHK